MRKAYALVIVLFLLPLFLLGAVSALDADETVSLTENRELLQAPAFDLDALFLGNWLGDFDAYYTDTFPQRERLLGLERHLNAFYVFSPYPPDSGQVTLVVPFDGGQIAHLDATPSPKPPATPSPTSAATPETPSGGTPPEPTPTPTPTPAPESGAASASGELDLNAGDVILVGDRAMYTAWKNESLIAVYGDAMNAYAEALGDVPLTCMLIPNAGAFYSPEEWHTGPRDQADIIATAYGLLPPSAATADAYGKLSAATDTYVYFRSDHHWTQRGAYRGYLALCETLGLEAPPLEDFRQGQVPGDFLGSFHTLLSGYAQVSALEKQPDTVEYFVDDALRSTVTAYQTAEMRDGTSCALLYSQYEGSNLYAAFLGGDHALLKITTNAERDKTALIVKDSNGNALIPFLARHYREVYVIDPRFFNLEEKAPFSLADFVAAQGVDEVLVVNGMGILNNAGYLSYLGALAQA